VRAYLAVLSARFRTLLQYRAAAAAGMVTQLFWGLIRVMIFEGFYRSTTASQPMPLEQVITYVWLGQATIGLLPWNMDPELRSLVRSGNVAYELVRPLDLYSLWYMRSAAHRLAPTLLRFTPLMVLAAMFFGLRPPASWAAGAAWLLSCVGALAIASAVSTLMAISMIRTLSGEGISRLIAAITVPLTGLVIPLPLFPDWAQPLLNFQPFRHIMDVPFRLYLGDLPASSIGWVLLQQAAWTGVLALLGRWVLARETRRLVVQGG
jgi:ABC-2 type transport system permease protein